MKCWHLKEERFEVLLCVPDKPGIRRSLKASQQLLYGRMLHEALFVFPLRRRGAR